MYKSFILAIIFLSSINISNANNLNVQYEQQGLVLIWGCDYDATVIRMSITVASITGGSGNYSIYPYGQGSVSNFQVSEGNGFTYYFTEDDQLNNNIGFFIDDGFGDFSNLDSNIATQLYLLPFNTCSPNFCPPIINQPASLDVTSLIYQADNELHSESIIKQGRDVIYKAGEFVELKAGFEVLPNAELEILIEDCSFAY